jgi:hypothetical protein
MTVRPDVSDTTIERIRKLMAHEQSAREIGSVAEAEAFYGKIQELLIKNKLEMDDIGEAEQDVQDDITVDLVQDPEYRVKRTRVAWEEHLAYYVSRAYFCQHLVSRGSNHIWMVGRSEDRAVATHTFIMLRRMIRDVSLKEYSKYFDACNEAGYVQQARGYRASWINAAVSALGKRFSEIRNAANGASTGTAIVLANADGAVKKYVEENCGGKVNGVSGKSTTNYAGAANGRQWGNSVSISGNGLDSGNTSSRRSLR